MNSLRQVLILLSGHSMKQPRLVSRDSTIYEHHSIVKSFIIRLSEAFDIPPSVFDMDKGWVSSQHLKRIDVEEIYLVLKVEEQLNLW